MSVFPPHSIGVSAGKGRGEDIGCWGLVVTLGCLRGLEGVFEFEGAWRGGEGLTSRLDTLPNGQF